MASLSPPRAKPEIVTLDALLARFDTLLLDAYGVLIDQQGPLPGAVALIERLNREHRPYLILTNSASRLPETMAEAFGSRGLAIPAERILSSGMLLANHFNQHRLCGARCLVLGPTAARTYVERAGGEIVPVQSGIDAEVIVIADQQGFALQQGLDRALTLMLQRLDRGDPLALIVCNPDLIYPVARGHYGVTAGALAAMLEAILRERYPDKSIGFTPLGKPHPPIFSAAMQQVSGSAVMLGDQLSTDILGAQRFGIATAQVMSGLARAETSHADIIPDYRLHSLEAG